MIRGDKKIPSLLGSFILINHSLPSLLVGYIFFIPKISFVVELEDGEDDEDGDVSGPLILVGLGTCKRTLLLPVSLMAAANLLFVGARSIIDKN
jgi:hypothetical protein